MIRVPLVAARWRTASAQGIDGDAGLALGLTPHGFGGAEGESGSGERGGVGIETGWVSAGAADADLCFLDRMRFHIRVHILDKQIRVDRREGGAACQRCADMGAGSDRALLL